MCVHMSVEDAASVEQVAAVRSALFGDDARDVPGHAVDVALQIGLARRRILAFWSAVLLSMVDALMLLALRIDLLTMHTIALLLRLAQLVVARTHCRFIIFARIRLGRTPRRSTRCLNLNRRAECVGALGAHTKRRTRSRNNNNT